MLNIKKTRENFHYVTLAGIYYLKDKFPYFRVLLFYFLKGGGQHMTGSCLIQA